MNKTIEFIEKEINICNQKIDFQTQVAFESQTNQFKKRYHENEARKLTEKLHSLKQVKAELEAWEVVKPYIKEGVSFTLSNFLKNNIDKFETLKKALEVEDANM